MDNLRGTFDALDNPDDYDIDADEPLHEAPPVPIGQDERRMQVRAYNHWASMLGDRSLPPVEDLEPARLTDFGPYSVLLDFTSGVENPAVAYLGDRLASECGGDEHGPIRSLADVPGRSLLSRITDHYMQILANKAPIGFEAEFVNQRGSTVLYRGILLPFSSDDDTIDFIYGVINWRELADQRTADELLLEIDQALEPKSRPDSAAALTDWADGPASAAAGPATEEAGRDDSDTDPLPKPQFGFEHLILPDADFAEDSGRPDEPPQDPAAMGLADWLAAARDMAAAARNADDRTRSALYEAIGRAYDFSLAADGAPGEFAALLDDAGLTAQQRAPMTPVVKLVFGADYDRTRLTEYAAALLHARRLGLARGTLAQFLRDADGGLKAVVKAERALRREETGSPARAAQSPRPAIARRLRAMAPHSLAELPVSGHEFALVMIRREDGGEVRILGEVPEDNALIERAARKLVAAKKG